MSIRETIITTLETTVGTIKTVKTVKRTIQGHEMLSEFAETQFPVVAIVGRLPQPIPHRSGRTKADNDMFISTLTIDFYCYVLENKDEDTAISELAEALWIKLYSDPTVGDNCLQMDLSFDGNVERWSPFVAFRLICNVKYVHDIGGI